MDARLCITPQCLIQRGVYVVTEVTENSVVFDRPLHEGEVGSMITFQSPMRVAWGFSVHEIIGQVLHGEFDPESYSTYVKKIRGNRITRRPCVGMICVVSSSWDDCTVRMFCGGYLNYAIAAVLKHHNVDKDIIRLVLPKTKPLERQSC